MEPALWNIFYDELLTMDVPAGVQLMTFADDVAVISIAHTGEGIETLLNPVLTEIST